MYTSKKAQKVNYINLKVILVLIIHFFLKNIFWINSFKKKKKDEIKLLESIYYFGWNTFSPIYTFKSLERWFSNNIYNLNQKKEKSTNKIKKVLHITTSINWIGGHTRVIQRWMELDKTKENYLIITKKNQNTNKTLEVLFKRFFDKILVLENDHLYSSDILSQFFKNTKIDLIVLHHFPDDILIFNLIKKAKAEIPVAIYNHASHVNWFGGTLVDCVINFHSKSFYNSLTYRGAKDAYLLKFPPPIESIHISKDVAIKTDKVTITTIFTPYKVKNYKKHDFMRNILDISVSLEKKVSINIIGMEKASGDHFYPPNVHFHGFLADPSSILMNSDIFLEPFPMGSYLATFDAMHMGCVILPNYLNSFLPDGNISSVLPEIEKMFPSLLSGDIKNYNLILKKLVEDDDYYLEVKDFFKSLRKFYSISKFQENLNGLYGYLEGKPTNIENKRELKNVLYNNFTLCDYKVNSYSYLINILISVNKFVNSWAIVIFVYILLPFSWVERKSIWGLKYFINFLDDRS